MIKKMIHLWTSFATKGQPDEAEWHPLSKDDHKWAAINRDGSIKMAWDEDFEHKVEFVRSMFEVLVGYRNMIFHDHPAAKEMLNRQGFYLFYIFFLIILPGLKLLNKWC